MEGVLVNIMKSKGKRITNEEAEIALKKNNNDLFLATLEVSDLKMYEEKVKIGDILNKLKINSGRIFKKFEKIEDKYKLLLEARKFKEQIRVQLRHEECSINMGIKTSGEKLLKLYHLYEDIKSVIKYIK